MSNFKEKAQLIFEEIKKVNNILLHCHVSPDADSLGSCLALKEFLERIGKNATLISGDDPIPKSMKHFPGADKVEEKNFFEVDLKNLDLLISLDTASIDMISKLGDVKFPENLKVIVIDHHISNTNFGDINLVEANFIAAGEIIYMLLKEWKVSVTDTMALNLFLAIYTDSGGLKFSKTTEQTYKIASELVSLCPDFSEAIFKLENSNSPEKIFFLGLALNSLEYHFDSNVVISAVSFEKLQDKGIPKEHTSKAGISNILISVEGWNIGITLVEREKGVISVDFRTRDPERFDVSKLAVALGGGGHKAAAGATIKGNFQKVKKHLLEIIPNIYPNLGS
ncbi:MAG: MgpA protein [Candidatus Daviesbacteria bacterium GW2011_GWA2_38_24]|uniref:MgpA protein n=1 Tax=Candidatus Daviesbacteria bacterium GW2011_GWA2_38_24 TaxID=1618422 RepID=A0A0G0JRC2_9BACT|nr:MAG: MgpA protein [Candidatus Daviesbacteria bacterium GW2011_GWA2_38_24]KKQ80683.1 MAG: MgpA protein [Candidatus Daviesbacteria bacterium GW2011_GWA1_38_7]OGE24313.1 MAG: hypothetical protein A2688_00015 [Candidatus Daviesbacteria bacterium RIFCSPHIGHO2_01_FULL_38_8]